VRTQPHKGYSTKAWNPPRNWVSPERIALARIPAVPLWGLLAGVFKGRKNQGKIHKFSFILLNNLIITIVVDLTRFYDSGIFMQVLEMYFNFFYVTFSYTR